MERNIFRGNIYSVDLGSGVGSEHSGYKYCVVVQNDIGNKHSGTTTIVPLSKVHKSMPTHIEIRDVMPETSYAICEQIRVVDKSRLGKLKNKLSPRQMIEVEKGIKLQLGL